jgi:hypothetical protein
MDNVPESEYCVSDVPELIPPVYYLYPILSEFILLSERVETPFNSNDDGSFYTFPKVELVQEDQEVQEVEVVQVVQAVEVVQEVKPVILQNSGFTDSQLSMSAVQVNLYVKNNNLTKEQEKLLKYEIRKCNNRRYSRHARIKKKANALKHEQPVIPYFAIIDECKMNDE